MLMWDHWHIEASSICALKCSRCPRIEVPETLLNRQLDLNFFQQQIGTDTIRQIRKITFCGNDGDPIYCKDLLAICDWIKTINPDIMIVIITNGSYRSPDWWSDLGRILDQNDELHWSIDGWDQASNEQYRINSDWASLMQGISSFASTNIDTYRVWAAIAFRFNENFLHKMRDMATKLHMDLFQLTKSTKFGSHYPDNYGVQDVLQPHNLQLISSSHRFERELMSLTQKQRPGNELKKIFFSRAQDLIKYKKYSGICLIGNKGIFVNSQGEFYPCCWTATRYNHNKQWHELAKQRFNLKKNTFQDIIKDSFWHDSFLEFESQECRTKCTVDRLVDIDHTTEW